MWRIRMHENAFICELFIIGMIFDKMKKEWFQFFKCFLSMCCDFWFWCWFWAFVQSLFTIFSYFINLESFCGFTQRHYYFMQWSVAANRDSHTRVMTSQSVLGPSGAWIPASKCIQVTKSPWVVFWFHRVFSNHKVLLDLMQFSYMNATFSQVESLKLCLF